MIDLSAPVEQVAPALLGCVLVAGGVSVQLTEVEAYGGQGEDPGSHAFRGPTARSAIMFGPPGRLYVYFSYGMHFCVNIVCEPAGRAAAVLLRAGRVVAGADLARQRRPGAEDRELCRGPARLAKATGIDLRRLGCDVLDPGAPVRLVSGERPGAVVSTGPRVGLSAGADTPWRFWVTADPTVSAYRPSARRVMT